MVSDVHRGMQGWLYHGQGRNNWLDYLTGIRQLSAEILDDWTQYYTRWQRSIEASERHFAVFVAPEKHSAVQDFLPGTIVPYSPGPLATFDERFRKLPFYVPLLEAFLCSSHRLSSYLRLDSHWSAIGAQIAYEAAMNGLGLAPIQEGRDFVYALDTRTGDLARELDSNEFEECLVPTFKTTARLRYSNGVRNIGRVLEYQCWQAPIRQAACIFGNSFSEAWLVDFLAHTFQRTFFVFSPVVDPSLVEEVEAKFVIHQFCERFLSVPPSVSSAVTPRARWLVKRMLGVPHYRESSRTSSGQTFMCDELWSAARSRNSEIFRAEIMKAHNFAASSEVAVLAYICSEAFDEQLFQDVRESFDWDLPDTRTRFEKALLEVKLRTSARRLDLSL